MKIHSRRKIVILKMVILRRGKMNDGKLHWNMPRQATEKRLEGDMEASLVSECGKDRYPSQDAAQEAIWLTPKKKPGAHEHLALPEM